ncbi:MAG: MarC family protein [Hyphomicrobiales bacterium]|jgi:multiple antibiotic resistance protein|nr:MarC family protein [Hyphomicrobiales bacterium]
MPADFLLKAFVTLFVIVDPLALAPVFLALTSGLGNAERRQVALRAVLIAFVVLTAFALGGQRFVALLGISFPAFRIAGGLLLFSIAFEMLFEKRQARHEATAEAARGEGEIQQIAAFPLAIPLISGPGAITATMLLAASAHGDYLRLGLLVAVIAVVMAGCLTVALLASRVDKLLGVTGRIVFSRLLGVVLAALAVQFVVDGVSELVRGASS